MTPSDSLYSEIPQIQQRLSGSESDLAKAGVFVKVKQHIPYGVQLILEGQGEPGLINVYFSKKKGLSYVDCSRNDVSQTTISLLRGESVDPTQSPVSAREAALSRWIGTDESGKGDFFGPLVVAGFYVDKEIEKQLKCLGVADSKKLQSGNIRKIASILRRDYPDHICVVAPHNQKYNDLYHSFKNLNKQLAWAHARVLEDLSTAVEKKYGFAIDGAVADQFGDERHIKNALPSMKAFNLIQRPRGESNTAVAAASIIARDTFEMRIRALSLKFDMNFPLGAGAKTLTVGREFVQKYGRERLGEVAKLHFKNASQL